MTPCFFVSDLHGRLDRYQKLFMAIRESKPQALFLGGDLLPNNLASMPYDSASGKGFLHDFLLPELSALRRDLKASYPRIFVIMGNDDARSEEGSVMIGAEEGLWEYIHMRRATLGPYTVFGYAYVPPTPFLLKDWERYDVSRFTDPGCVAPEEGFRTQPAVEQEIRYATIKADLETLTSDAEVSKAILLFHAPPYQTALDRAALDNKFVNHVPLDVHIGSIAIRQFIERRQPYLTLHGHVHESSRLTGSWREIIGRTHCWNTAHDGPELSLIRFELDHVEDAMRNLI